MNIKSELPFILTPIVGLFLVPLLIKSHYILFNLTMIFLYGMVVLSWNLAVGYTGVLLFGQLAFFGIGGYTTGLITLGLPISPWIGLVLGGFVAALFGFLIGLPLLRLKGLSVVLVTFAFQEIVRVVILNLRDITGGVISTTLKQ